MNCIASPIINDPPPNLTLIMDNPIFWGYQIASKMMDLPLLWKISGGYDSTVTWQKTICTFALLWLDYFIHSFEKQSPHKQSMSDNSTRKSLNDIDKLCKKMHCDKFSTLLIVINSTVHLGHIQKYPKLNYDPPRFSITIPFHTSKIPRSTAAIPQLRNCFDTRNPWNRARNQGTQDVFQGYQYTP